MKVCDHKSVGMLVWQDDKLLLIERAKFPFGFAPPAGHVDDDPTFEEAAVRELQEEVGLTAEELALRIEGRKDTKCRRPEGDWHYWKMYDVQSSGEIKRSEDETKQVGWYSKEEIKALAKRTEQYLNKEITEVEWESAPGLELVMYQWFTELQII